MPYNIKQVGDKFAVVATNTGKVVGTHPSKKKAQAQLAALYANVEDVKKCMTCGCEDIGTDHDCIPIKKESAGAERLSGGPGFKLEYNVPDCLGGYAITKAGSGQVVGCYTTKEHAQEAMRAIAVNEPDLTKSITVSDSMSQAPTEDGDDQMNFWTGAFSPFAHRAVKGEPMAPTYNTPPQKDGQPSVGYGNSSSPKGKSNS